MVARPTRDHRVRLPDFLVIQLDITRFGNVFFSAHNFAGTLNGELAQLNLLQDCPSKLKLIGKAPNILGSAWPPDTSIKTRSPLRLQMKNVVFRD